MANEVLKRDQNRITVLGGVTDDADLDITMLRVDSLSKRLLVKASLSGGGAVKVEVPPETPDGSRTAFTFLFTPKVITVDQGRTMRENVGWTYSDTTVTFDVAPTFDVFSIY